MKEEMNKVKALFPDNIEKIIISKNDYDRLTGELTLENIKLKQEIDRLNNIIKEAKDFINGKDLKENEYRFAEDFDFGKLLEILDKGENNE